MALWGNSDDLTIAGAPTGALSLTVVGTASSEFWTATGSGLSNVPTGTTVILDDGLEGFVVLEAELATDLFRVGKMSAVAAGAYTPTYASQPISLKNDPAYAPASPDGELDRSEVVAGVSTAGVAAAGLTTTTGGFHAGWVGIMTYVDMHGNLRTKTETFVAASGIATGNRPYPA